MNEKLNENQQPANPDTLDISSNPAAIDNFKQVISNIEGRRFSHLDPKFLTFPGERGNNGDPSPATDAVAALMHGHLQLRGAKDTTIFSARIGGEGNTQPIIAIAGAEGLTAEGFNEVSRQARIDVNEHLAALGSSLRVPELAEK
jgi:hypothetical protein